MREYNRSRESLELVPSKLGKFLFSRKLELESCPRVTFIYTFLYNDPIRKRVRGLEKSGEKNRGGERLHKEFWSRLGLLTKVSTVAGNTG